MIGFECSIAVSDIEATAAAVAEHGGEVLLQPMRIESVGTMIQFADTEGNVVGAMQYDDGIGKQR
jgi:predicted enzyme related to lactoylglutathione lyase